MASLIQELIATLSRECTLYEQLIPVSEQKTQALVKSDLDLLQQVTDSEQAIMDEITALESVRQETIQNMSVVLGREPESLDLTTIGKILSKQPQEQSQIHALHDRLRKAAKRLVDINVQNKSLIDFELFGTLVNTPFSENNDLFLLMEKEFPKIRTAKCGFSDLRIEAEADAKRKNKDKCSVTVSRIYEILAKKAKLSNEIRDALIKRECDMAVSLVFPRGFGRKLFDSAAESGKKIIILANSVYPRDVIMHMLGKCGYTSYNELIVTTEVDCGENRSKAAFDAVIKKEKAAAKQLLHIGGDVAADVESPIMKGAKALLLPDTASVMSRSGRLSGYLRAARIYDYDTAEFLALHLALGLYAAYVFDIPRTKSMHSDFCANAYILGFIVYGCCNFADISELDDTCTEILGALKNHPEIRRGGEDFNELFKRHFEAYLGKFSYNGFTLPLEMLARHGGSMDAGLLKAYMPEKSYKKWKDGITDAVTAPTGKRTEQNKLEKLADRMFPPGTKVRNMAEGVLFKLKGKL